MLDVLRAISESAKNERVKYHLTLGELIRALETCDQNLFVHFDDEEETSPHNPHSYRGYYSDLAFEPSENPIIVSNFLNLLKNKVLNKKFIGWKGGEFIMDEDVPIWKSFEGSSSNNEAVIGLCIKNDKFILKIKALKD